MCTLVGAKQRFSFDLNQAFTKLSHPARYNEAINPEFLVGGNVPVGAFAVIVVRHDVPQTQWAGGQGERLSSPLPLSPAAELRESFISS